MTPCNVVTTHLLKVGDSIKLVGLSKYTPSGNGRRINDHTKVILGRHSSTSARVITFGMPASYMLKCSLKFAPAGIAGAHIAIYPMMLEACIIFIRCMWLMNLSVTSKYTYIENIVW